MSKKPVRMCVACRERAEKEQLLRLVSRGGSLIVDQAGRAPGRGVYVHSRPSCVRRIAERGLCERAMRLPAGTLEEAQLRQLAGELWASLQLSTDGQSSQAGCGAEIRHGGRKVRL